MGTIRTNVHDHQYAEDAENTTYITTVKKTTSVLTSKETGSGDCEIKKKSKRNYLTKTYPKYYLSRSKKDSRDHKIYRSDQKKISQQPTKKAEVFAQLVNKMRALIQKMKTVIGAVTEKLSQNPNIRVETNYKRQADRKSPGALTSEVASVNRPPQTSPKREITGNPSSTNGQGNGTKLGENRSRSRTRITPRKDKFDPMETQETEDETPHQDKIQ